MKWNGIDQSLHKARTKLLMVDNLWDDYIVHPPGKNLGVYTPPPDLRQWTFASADRQHGLPNYRDPQVHDSLNCYNLLLLKQASGLCEILFYLSLLFFSHYN